MSLLDLLVIVVYLAATLSLGLVLARGQTTVRDYFAAGRRAPWGVVMASIVATETSTATLVSVPGFAFGTDLTFLQLVFGYLAGRAIITVLLLRATSGASTSPSTRSSPSASTPAWAASPPPSSWRPGTSPTGSGSWPRGSCSGPPS